MIRSRRAVPLQADASDADKIVIARLRHWFGRFSMPGLGAARMVFGLVGRIERKQKKKNCD
jgi:hypothetical protein